MLSPHLRKHTEVNSERARFRLFGIRGSASSLITRNMRAGCFLKLQGWCGFLATPGKRTTPLFSKVHGLLCFLFVLSDTLPDVCGRLEGESIVGAAIEGIPNLWCFEERPLFLVSDSHPTHSPNWYRPSLTATAAQITSAEGILIRDWREPIRRMLRSRDVNIRITDKPPGSSRSDYSAASPSADSRSGVSALS